MTGPEHYQRAEELIADITNDDGSVSFGEGGEAYAAAAQVHATLALAAGLTLQTSAEGCSRYGSEFDRLADRWQALETEHDQMHPDRDECGGVGGCSMMYAAHDLERQLVDQLEDWRVAIAVREGLRPCRCDHHGDHAGCDADCECAR